MSISHKCRTAIGYSLGVVGLVALTSIGSGSAALAQGAGPVTDANVVERVVNMKTPADHTAIADYYQAKAATAATEVTRHEAMVKSYENMGNPAKQMAAHCGRLLDAAKKEHAEYESLAKDHAAMAAAAKK